MINHTNDDMKDDGNRVTYIGNTDYRARDTKFGIKDKDRTRHMYVIGKTGMGKSTLLENMAVQDIQNGNGVCIIDPHGSTAETLLKYIPEHRIKDVVYFAPHDIDFPLALNVLEKVEENQRHLVANGLMAAFKKIFGEDKFSDRIQYILNNIMLALLENEGQTLLGVNRMLSDANYRKFIVSNVKDPSVRAFWNEEFVRAGEKYAQEAAPGIQNKIGQFISNPLIRNIIGQKKTSFDIRDIMDNKKILICNFSIGRMGEGNVNLLGNLMITKIYLAAMSRANLGADEMMKAAPFYFYVDEFQNFVNESFAQILSQARKYNLALTIAHQYVDQMTDEVKAAVFGNVGSMILFRVGADDAERFEKEFAPQFTMDDIVNLSARQIYLRLSIDGVGSKPFSAKTLPPVTLGNYNYTNAIIAHSRVVNAKSKTQVEEEVNEFYKPIVIAKAPKSEDIKVKEEHKYKENNNKDQRNENRAEHRADQHRENRHNDNLDKHKEDVSLIRDNSKDQRNENRSDNRMEGRAEDRAKGNSLRDALHKALGVNEDLKIDIGQKPKIISVATDSNKIKSSVDNANTDINKSINQRPNNNKEDLNNKRDYDKREINHGATNNESKREIDADTLKYMLGDDKVYHESIASL